MSLLTSRPCPVCLCCWLCKPLLQHLLLQAHFQGPTLISYLMFPEGHLEVTLTWLEQRGLEDSLNDHFCGAHPHSPRTLTSTSREATGREGTGPQVTSQSSTPGRPLQRKEGQPPSLTSGWRGSRTWDPRKFLRVPTLLPGSPGRAPSTLGDGDPAYCSPHPQRVSDRNSAPTLTSL